jgi:hypothetical protein
MGCILSQDSTGGCGFHRKTVGAARAEGSTGMLEVHGVGRDSRNLQGGHLASCSSPATGRTKARTISLFKRSNINTYVTKLWQNRERLNCRMAAELFPASLVPAIAAVFQLGPNAEPVGRQITSALLASCVVCPTIALRRANTPRRWVKVYEVRNHASNPGDHRGRRPVAALSD